MKIRSFLVRITIGSDGSIPTQTPVQDARQFVFYCHRPWVESDGAVTTNRSISCVHGGIKVKSPNVVPMVAWNVIFLPRNSQLHAQPRSPWGPCSPWGAAGILFTVRPYTPWTAGS